MEQKAITLVLVAFIIAQMFFNVVFSIALMGYQSQQAVTEKLEKDFVDSLKAQGRMITATMFAHNREVESWFAGNSKINKVTADFFWTMKNATQAGILDGFNSCIKNYTEYIIVEEPNINADGSVDGYMMKLYDNVEFNYIGGLSFSKDSAIYSTSECGSVHYNATAKLLSYTFRNETTGKDEVLEYSWVGG